MFRIEVIVNGQKFDFPHLSEDESGQMFLAYKKLFRRTSCMRDVKAHGYLFMEKEPFYCPTFEQLIDSF